MKNKLEFVELRRIFGMIGCCAVFFCAASGFGQSYDTCAHLKLWEHGSPSTQEDYKKQYDTLRLYIERCAASDDQSFHAFGDITGAVQFMDNDTTRFDRYRDWLISVIYLNKTNPAYFCSCMGAIEDSYQEGSIYFHYVTAPITVRDYLKKNHPECVVDDSFQFAQDTLYLRQHGIDPTKSPPLDSIGLGFLLHNAVVPNSGGKLTTDYLGSFTSSPNPFIKETTLEFTLNRMSYITIAVFDDLGRLVWGDGRGSSLEAGIHSIHLEGSSLPSGTLYARISTGFGEVKTVKLIHEK